jgi:hypothetical protein
MSPGMTTSLFVLKVFPSVSKGLPANRARHQPIGRLLGDGLRRAHSEQRCGNAPGYLQLANIWMILNVGGGPTPDKPTVTLSVPDPTHINSFINFRVAEIKACYQLWKSRGVEFITEPIPKYGETRCYIRDPDGYIIQVGQSTDLKYG